METKPEKKYRRPRGRPFKNQIQQIPDSPQDIARGIFRGADKKVKKGQ
jgi:hypothetical protein